MRAIGQIADEAGAKVFGDYLLVQGIQNQVEPDDHGQWTVWIHEDDQLGKSQSLLAEFQGSPKDPKYRRTVPRAKELRKKEEEEEKAWRKRFIKRGTFWRGASWRIGGVTAALIAISISVAMLQWIRGPEHGLVRLLCITDYAPDEGGRIYYTPGLPEVRSGQLWRIATPIFLHFGPLHLIFNMMWLLSLGSMVEARQGSLKLARLVLVIAALSNLAQYWFHGPAFGGMSGVVYGLFGYVWVRSKLDPRSGYFIDQTSLILMLVWFVAGMTVVSGIANVCHASGLVLGLLWGFAAARLNN